MKSNDKTIILLFNRLLVIALRLLRFLTLKYINNINNQIRFQDMFVH